MKIRSCPLSMILAGLYRQSNEICALDREITRSFRKYKTGGASIRVMDGGFAMDRGRS